MADIDTVERLLCERYNVRELDEGELSNSLKSARKGDTTALRQALDARDLYRWRADIYKALGPAAAIEAEPKVVAKPKARTPRKAKAVAKPKLAAKVEVVPETLPEPEPTTTSTTWTSNWNTPSDNP